MQDLIGKKIEVLTYDEITYRGVLVQTGESEIHLQAETGWIAIRIDRILNVKQVS